MENHDYYAFLESICADESGAFTLEDKIEADNELSEYYQCLAELEEQIENEELSVEQRECAYADYLSMTGSHEAQLEDLLARDAEMPAHITL